MNNNRAKYLKIIAYLFSLYLFQELIFRMCFPVPEIANFDRINYMKLFADGKGSQHSRDHIWEWQSQLDTSAVFLHKMNRYGFRDQEWTIAKSGKKRALFIGDSFVEGLMVNEPQSIPAVFETISNGEYEAYNAGMLGVGLDSYLQLSADIIPVYKPEVAFLCIYANDLGKQEPAVPEFYLEPEYFSFLKPRLLEILDQSNTYGPLNFRWKSKSEPYLPAVPNAANPWTFDESNLITHVTPEFAEAMKSARINPFLVNGLSKEESMMKHDPLLGETVPFFQYTCAENQVKPVIVYIPSRNQITKHYYQYERNYCLNCDENIDLTTPDYNIHQAIIADQCKQFGVQFIDLTEAIRQMEANGNHLYWKYDQHMRAKGYNFVAKIIGEKYLDN